VVRALMRPSSASWLHAFSEKRSRDEGRGHRRSRPRGGHDAEPLAESDLGDALIIQYRKEIADFAMRKRLPSVFTAKDRVEAGGLMSYGPRYSEMMRHAASLVDKILRGAEPANLAMEQPTTFDLVINLKTARAIGLDVPATLLARAEEVIE
jgi:ABC transporter substrate binding protein